MRIDPAVQPTTYRRATVSTIELTQLRRTRKSSAWAACGA